MARLLVWALKFWNSLLSPVFGARCRFYPSCSCFAVQALEKHGLFKGSLLAAHRVLRCHPLSKGGVEPVP